MKEESQVQQETKNHQQVTTKNPNKVKAGKRLAEYIRKKREELKEKSEAQSEVSQYYGIGAVLAVGVIGWLGYYIYRTKKGEAPPYQPQPPQQPRPQSNKFEMD